ncbi:MAG: hypothetical protein AAFN27_13370 [Pseudomonadota bacterium]
MQKVIVGTLAAALALAATAATAQDQVKSNPQPTAIERIFGNLTGATSTKTATQKHSLSASDRVVLNGYASTGKPELDAWVLNLRRSRGGGPNG